MNARITQLTAVVAQMATILNQVNRVPIPRAMQELGANIPRPHGQREEPNQSRTFTQDRQSSGTHNRRRSQSQNHESRGPWVSGHHSENTASREVVPVLDFVP